MVLTRTVDYIYKHFKSRINLLTKYEIVVKRFILRLEIFSKKVQKTEQNIFVATYIGLMG